MLVRTVFLLSFSINLQVPAFYHEWHSLIGCSTHCLSIQCISNVLEESLVWPHFQIFVICQKYSTPTHNRVWKCSQTCHLTCSVVFDIFLQSSNLGSRIHWQEWSRSQASSRGNIDNQTLSSETSKIRSEWLGCVCFVLTCKRCKDLFFSKASQLLKHITQMINNCRYHTITSSVWNKRYNSCDPVQINSIWNFKPPAIKPKHANAFTCRAFAITDSDKVEVSQLKTTTREQY